MNTFISFSFASEPITDLKGLKEKLGMVLAASHICAFPEKEGNQKA